MRQHRVRKEPLLQHEHAVAREGKHGVPRRLNDKEHDDEPEEVQEERVAKGRSQAEHSQHGCARHAARATSTLQQAQAKNKQKQLKTTATNARLASSTRTHKHASAERRTELNATMARRVGGSPVMEIAQLVEVSNLTLWRIHDDDKRDTVDGVASFETTTAPAATHAPVRDHGRHL
jgi:hypothetical protein